MSERRVSRPHRRIVACLVVQAMGLTLAGSQLSSAATATSLAAIQPAKSDYASIVSGCGRKEQNVQFLKVFNGHWPIPSHFVLVDSTNDQLEYSDLAFPWSEPKVSSNIFFAPKGKFIERWGWLNERKYVDAGTKCAVRGRRYEYVDEFGGPAVLFTDGNQHLLLIGPIANASSEALACYAAALVQRGRSC